MSTCKSCAVGGSLGTCTNIPAGKPDLVGFVLCLAIQACDGNGGCKKASGQTCSSSQQCATGFCRDGYCCDQTCLTPCWSCNVATKQGACSPTPAGKADTYATKACMGLEACDGKGGCKKSIGQACTTNLQCGSGFCVDGYCCATACTDVCKTCGTSGSLGACSFVAAGKTDPGPLYACTGKKACDGKGTCKKQNGGTCATGAECQSGYCADGYCCGSACLDTCKTCGRSGSEGACVNTASGSPDPVALIPCSSGQVCNGLGQCKKSPGKSCASATECSSGFCMDYVCCDKACTGTCMSCAVPGQVGTCSGIPSGKTDPSGLNPCTGPNACNGYGACRKVNGQYCKTGPECVSGHCMDNVCCDQACAGTCMSCAVTGKLGACSAVPAGKTDTVATVPCSGQSACDGKGTCLKANGQACASGSSCGSGLCVDGVCCDALCDSTCKSCAVKGSEGTCSNVPAGSADTSAKTTCMGTSACDGSGGCKKGNGQACTVPADCGSGQCVDGFCCDSACGETCKACNVSGFEGTCSFVPAGKPDATGATACSGSKACDGNGKCLKATGQICSSGNQCGSDHCWDTRCCDVSCDKVCRSCNLSQKEGTCSFILQGDDPDNDCIGKHALCGGACDGKGACEFPGLGTNCGTCKACDGTGNCTGTPTDDIGCGTIDCDKLDTACRDYHDLTTARCDSFGACKKPNLAATCVKYTELCGGDAGAGDRGVMEGGVDAGPARPDKGTTPPGGGDDGCAVGAREGTGRPSASWLVLLALLALRTGRRRRD